MELLRSGLPSYYYICKLQTEYDMENRLTVGFTHGDVNGIGYELIIKMMAENRICEVCTPVLFGSSKVAAYHRKALNIENFSLNSIQNARDANPKRCNIVNCVDDAIKVDLGQETPESDDAAVLALKAALTALDRNEIDVLVGAPQGCNSFKPAASCPVFFSERYETRNVMPLLVGEKMKMGFVTNHLPFRDIAGNITVNNIYYKLKLLDACLKKDFTIRKPRIAVLGLNPHSGENCMYGEEERNVIIPAIERARDNGIMALGPYAPDGLFSGVEFEKFDVILAMYHDQGLAPFKALAMDEGVNYTAGLPVVRTSPAHGTAYDIAGKGLASEDSFRQAVYVAIDVFRNRLREKEAHANPLRKQYYERRDDSDKLKLDSVEEDL